MHLFELKAAGLSAPADLPGLEVGAALRTTSFWMIAITQFCYAFYVSAIALHLIPFLIGIGYAPKLAALVLSIAFGINSLLKFGIGWFADLVRRAQRARLLQIETEKNSVPRVHALERQ